MSDPADPSRRRLALLLAAVATLVTAVSALGIGVRSTYGGRAAVDEPEYLLTALSLAEDGDLDISDELTDRRWTAFHDVELPVQTAVLPGGRRVSPHDPLLPVLLAVPMRWGGFVAAKAVLAVLAGGLAALTCWVAVRRLGVRPLVAATVVTLLSASAPLAVYGTQVYPEIPAALAVMVAVAAITGPLGRGGLTTLGAAVTALPWLSVKYVAVAAALTVVGALRVLRARDGQTRSDRRDLAGFCAGLAVMAVGYLVGHRLLYGGWTSYATGDTFARAGELAVVGRSPDAAGRSTRLVGLLVDRGFGIAAWQPAWLVAVPAVVVGLRDRAPWRGAVLVPLAAGYLTASFVALTAHGYWWPGRQLVVVLPLAVLATCAWCDGAKARHLATAGLALAGVMTLGWLLLDGHGKDITWVTRFERTDAPSYQALRPLLPDYRATGPARWAMHVGWTLALAGVAAASWGRRPGRGTTAVAAAGIAAIALAGARLDDGSDVRYDDGYRDPPAVVSAPR